MSKHLLTGILMLTILSACVSTANNSTSSTSGRRQTNNTEPVTTNFFDIDTTQIIQPSLSANQLPISLTELPRTEEGDFLLSPGFYEADFKSYCLQPGTPGPSQKDAYFQARLTGSRKDIIQTVLHKSQKETHLDQKHIQLLLWSVVSRSDFNKLSPAVQSTAVHLLTPKQLFELKGGVMGVVKTVVTAIPSNGNNKLHGLFEAGIHSYEAYERLAVVSGSSEISRPGFKREQWYKTEDGYFVRYLPNDYKQTKVQVFVPEVAMDAATEYIVFNPASLVVVPANSNAQRLGIGGPVLEVVRSVIKVIGTRKVKKQPEAPKQPEPPRPTGHPGARD